MQFRDTTAIQHLFLTPLSPPANSLTIQRENICQTEKINYTNVTVHILLGKTLLNVCTAAAQSSLLAG